LISDLETGRPLYDAFSSPTQIKFNEMGHPDPESRIDGNSIILGKKLLSEVKVED